MPTYRKINRPEKDEYPAAFQMYMDQVPAGVNILEELHDNFFQIKDFIYSLPQEKLSYRYAPGKWTIREILVHMIDTDRISAYRALATARKEGARLPGYDEAAYMKHSEADTRSLDSIFEEFERSRFSTLSLFKNLPEEALTRGGRGEAVDKGTVRAIAYFLAGHELHHLKVIRERYL